MQKKKRKKKEKGTLIQIIEIYGQDRRKQSGIKTYAIHKIKTLKRGTTKKKKKKKRELPNQKSIYKKENNDYKGILEMVTINWKLKKSKIKKTP